jgi:hypothetical protein
MAQKPTKRLSRRDALKLLGTAAGGSMMAALPPKWTSPRVTPGSLPANGATSPVLPTVTTDNVEVGPSGLTGDEVRFTGIIQDNGGCALTQRGFVWGYNADPDPTLGSNFNLLSINGDYGPPPLAWQQVAEYSDFNTQGTFKVRAYATNCVGTAYGVPLTFEYCLAAGTLVTLADGTVKAIEDVGGFDLLRVWNFDEGRFDTARPLWIKRAEATDQYNLLEFSDGSSLKTISQHRIFNKQLGMFTYPMTEDTPVGTTTFSVEGREATLVGKSVVREPVNYYNIITDHHINLFGNGILTSCRYNNIYPIADMRFVKDGRALRPREEYVVAERFYTGLRLAEQTIRAEDTFAYVRRLEEREALPELVIR